MSDLNNDDVDSKSKRKRDSIALQKLGELLVKLPASQLAKIPLEDPLRKEILFARTLKTHESKRRQLQYIGKVMRHVDVTEVQKAVEKLQQSSQESKAQFHQIERWRDKLIAEGDPVLQEFIVLHPEVDHQYLRQLIRKAQKNPQSGADTELFRCIRKAIENK